MQYKSEGILFPSFADNIRARFFATSSSFPKLHFLGVQAENGSNFGLSVSQLVMATVVMGRIRYFLARCLRLKKKKGNVMVKREREREKSGREGGDAEACGKSSMEAASVRPSFRSLVRGEIN